MVWAGSNYNNKQIETACRIWLNNYWLANSHPLILIHSCLNYRQLKSFILGCLNKSFLAFGFHFSFRFHYSFNLCFILPSDAAYLNSGLKSDFWQKNELRLEWISVYWIMNETTNWKDQQAKWINWLKENWGQLMKWTTLSRKMFAGANNWAGNKAWMNDCSFSWIN